MLVFTPCRASILRFPTNSCPPLHPPSSSACQSTLSSAGRSKGESRQFAHPPVIDGSGDLTFWRSSPTRRRRDRRHHPRNLHLGFDCVEHLPALDMPMSIAEPYECIRCSRVVDAGQFYVHVRQRDPFDRDRIVVAHYDITDCEKGVAL